MFLIEKQENEYRKVIWGENDSSQDYKDSVYKKHQVLVKEKVEFAKNTIRENRDDERFLKVLDIYVRNFLSLDEFEAELKMFSFQVQKTEACQRYFEFIKYARINTPGKQCIDFEMKGHDGKTIKFSDVYKKHKLVLIDFWASWCGPCRKAIPHVWELYREYPKELQVFSVSLDEKQEEWKKAMAEEKMEWMQLRCAGEMLRDVAMGYRLSSIPYLVLLNSEGKVMCATNSVDDVINQLKNALKD